MLDVQLSTLVPDGAATISPPATPVKPATDTTTTNNNTDTDTSVLQQQLKQQQSLMQPIGRLPTYIDSSLLRFYNLSSAGRIQAEKILWQLCETHPQITFAPILYPVVAIFLHYFDHEQTYRYICDLLQQNQRATRDRQFKRVLMPTTRLEHVRDIIVLIKLCTKFGIIAPFLMRDLVREENRFLATLDGDNSQITNHNITFDTPFLDWYKWIFVALPFTYCVKILDCWLIDGQKFLYRIALALLERYRQQTNQRSLVADQMFEFCLRLETILEPRGGVDQLIKEARSLKRISTVKIAKASRSAEIKATMIIESIMRKKNNYNLTQQPRNDMLTNVIISPRIAPRSFKSSIVDDYRLLDNLWQYLPERAAVKIVKIVFNSNQDGTSLQTFFSRVDPYEETIIIIRTIRNEVFGAFCSSSWSLRNEQAQKSASYFGNGDTFLFTLWPEFAVYLWVGKTNRDRESVIDSVSTQLFMNATAQELIIGSGNGSFGLWLDADLTRGKTDNCKTFNNQPLCENKDFTCNDVEVLAFA